MKQASRFVVVSALAIMAGMTLVNGSTAAGQAIQSLNARVVAINIPGASAIAQIGDFLNVPPAGRMRKPDTEQLSCIHQTGCGAGSSPPARRQPLELRRAARHRRRAGGVVPVDRSQRDRYSDRSGKFREERAFRHRPSAGRCRCSAPTALTGSTASTTPERTQLCSLESATPSDSPTTMPSGGSGRPTHRLATPASARPRSSIRPGCRSKAPRTRTSAAFMWAS